MDRTSGSCGPANQIARVQPIANNPMSDFGGHRVFVSHSARTLPVFLIPQQVAESP